MYQTMVVEYDFTSEHYRRVWMVFSRHRFPSTRYFLLARLLCVSSGYVVTGRRRDCVKFRLVGGHYDDSLIYDDSEYLCLRRLRRALLDVSFGGVKYVTVDPERLRRDYADEASKHTTT